MTLEARLELTLGAFRLDAELSVPARGVTAVFGRSGSGKTTLLRAIAGLEPDARGRVAIGGEIWQDGPLFTPAHRRAIGYVFQEPSLFSHLSVRGNLAYAWRRARAGDSGTSLEDTAALLGLTPLLARRSESLSGGERQRVAIARALLTRPRLLLLDEPLSSLDLLSKHAILPYLERLHAAFEIPVLYVSHSPDEVARLADQIALLDAGRILATGPATEMLTRLDLPLARGADAEALVEARVVELDAAHGLAVLDAAPGRLVVPDARLEIGSDVRLRILARDVSLTLERQTKTSILNIFPARVASITDESASQVIVRLDAGGTPILSRITRRSREALGLAPGSEVYAQVKSIAVLA